MTDGHFYAVGELFDPRRCSYPDGTTVFGMGMLVVFRASPTANEIEAFRRAPMRLGVVEVGGCLFVLYAVKGFDGDAPYDWHLASESERVIPEPLTPKQRLLICVYLVDARTGVIRAMRQTSMSRRVSRALVEAVRRQSAIGGFDRLEYDARLARVYDRWRFADLERMGVMDGTGGDESVEVLVGEWNAIAEA
jgi:hypothetical protein